MAALALVTRRGLDEVIMLFLILLLIGLLKARERVGLPLEGHRLAVGLVGVVGAQVSGECGLTDA